MGQAEDKYWIKPGVKARHKTTGMILTVMVLVSGVYKSIKNTKPFTYVYGADCEIHGKICRFHTKELEPYDDGRTD